jgi:hypothetical protein
MHAYFAGVQTMSQNSGPLRGMMRAQLEVMGLMNRRAQACMDFPSRLAKCRTPQELMSAQAQFWQMAFSQYSDTSRRVMETWSQSLQASGLAGTANARTEHDYITFPAAKEPEPPATSPTVHRLRRRRVA